MMRCFVLTIVTLGLLAAMRSEAHADQIKLTCFEVSLASPIFIDTGGIRDTSSYNRTVEISIDSALGIVTMSNNYDNSSCWSVFSASYGLQF
jgi:hypothetical protein